MLNSVLSHFIVRLPKEFRDLITLCHATFKSCKIHILEQNMFLCTASVMIFYICDHCEIMVWGHEVHNSIDKHKHMAYKTWLNTNVKRVAMLFGLRNRWKPSPSLWTGDWFLAYIKPELLKKDVMCWALERTKYIQE